jgi:hypothetical protein
VELVAKKCHIIHDDDKTDVNCWNLGIKPLEEGLNTNLDTQMAVDQEDQGRAMRLGLKSI